MRILHIVPSYLPAWSYGGPILSVHTLNKWLVREGADVTVYTTDIDGRKRLNVPLNREVGVDGVKVWYFPITFAPWQYSSAMCRALKRNLGEFDVVHITSVFLSASTLGAHYAKKFGKPYVISPRGSLMREPLMKKSSFLKNAYISLVEKCNLRGASAVHFTTEAEEKEYREAGLPIKRSFLIPNGFDTKEFEKMPPRGFFREKFGVDGNKKIVLFLGRVNWKKGFDTLIPAFKKIVIKDPRATLVVVGGDDEGYRKQVEKLIKECDVTGKVVFTGALRGYERAGAFKDSQVFVLPSYSENFGMAVVEAMHMGLPVVVTKGVGISSAIDRADAGIVVNKTEEELAHGILKILENPKLAEQMGSNGKKLVEKEFSARRVAQLFLETYNEITK